MVETAKNGGSRSLLWATIPNPLREKKGIRNANNCLGYLYIEVFPLAFKT